MTSKPHLVKYIFIKILERYNWMRDAQKTTHISIIHQINELIRLKLGKTRMEARDYFEQRLFDKTFYANSELLEFGGYSFKEWIHAQLNNIRWEGMVTDKLVLYALFKQYALPYPKVHAVAFNYKRNYGDIPVFHESGLLADFIRNSMPYPFFCKPIKGCLGQGSFLVKQYNCSDDQLVLNSGEKISVMDFIFSLNDGDGFGFLFQEVATVNHEIKSICGNVITGCRIIMLLDDKNAYPFRISWKIPTEKNHIDNFKYGKFGNLAADVDVETGRVKRVVSYNGSKLVTITHHPITNINLIGYQLPDWNNFIATAKKAAECFPGFRWQHWDLGITEFGPIIYELNSAGNTDLAQMSSGKGIYDDQLKSFIKKYSNKKRPTGNLFTKK
ncbi:MAG: sugar-transfer associated ATP-grasp domain-containing protein [Candidatus Heimdallarchaeota archaeon]